jgi:hypothetical protein
MSGTTYNTNNYQEQGGKTWIVGGTLKIAATGSIVPSTGTIAAHIPAATGAAGANPTQAEYAALVAAFNALVTACQGAGILAAS